MDWWFEVLDSVFIHIIDDDNEKQTNNRNETGSNLSLGARLTLLSKRLGRKRCCDAKPDRCLEVCRLTIFASHCKKNASSSSKMGGGGIRGLKRTKWKIEYAQLRHFRRINSRPKVKVCQLVRLYHPKEMKTSLPKVQALKVILQKL